MLALGNIPNLRRASVQKTGQKLPQFKTGTNISRTKTFKIEPKRLQLRTPLPPLGPLSRVQPANNPESFDPLKNRVMIGNWVGVGKSGRLYPVRLDVTVMLVKTVFPERGASVKN